MGKMTRLWIAMRVYPDSHQHEAELGIFWFHHLLKVSEPKPVGRTPQVMFPHTPIPTGPLRAAPPRQRQVPTSRESCLEGVTCTRDPRVNCPGAQAHSLEVCGGPRAQLCLRLRSLLCRPGGRAHLSSPPLPLGSPALMGHLPQPLATGPLAVPRAENTRDPHRGCSPPVPHSCSAWPGGEVTADG